MRILSVDISGKVFKYDQALYKSVIDNISSTDAFAFICPYGSFEQGMNQYHLCNLISARYRNSSQIWKRVFKAIEVIINYIIVTHIIQKEHIEVLHMQWLPFLEVCSFERYWLRYIKRMHPKIKIILTMHNIFPHNSSEQNKIKYRKRVIKIIPLLDAWIVHTNDAKERLMLEYHLAKDHIYIIHHGVFVPSIAIPERHRTDNKIRFLLFASQSLYKGTDLLVEAIDLLSATVKKNIDVRIMGNTDYVLYNNYIQKAKKNHIIWNNAYVSELDLVQAIQDSDVLVFPYRAITQSGALLLGIFFHKPMIVSNLPAFIETLGKEYPESLIFKTGDIQSLADTISHCVQQNVKLPGLSDLLLNLAESNSWKKAAQKTNDLYHAIHNGT